jgi:hypothetical protein
MQPIRAYAHPGFERKPLGIPPEPFRSAEQAWFWTMAALLARHEGGSNPGGRGVLRAWGERGVSPDGRHAAERAEARLWSEAMALLEWPLRVRGIVVAPISEF